MKRINLNIVSDVSQKVEEEKPAWIQLQESIKDSYYDARKNAERRVEESAFNDSKISKRNKTRSESPFKGLSVHNSSSQIPSYRAMNYQGLYAAPAVSYTQGIEERYSNKANEIEARILKTSILPELAKTITAQEFAHAPTPAAGSISEKLSDSDTEFQTFMPRSYYSRPNRDDPDYFDFDLQHSVDLYKRPEGKYVPRGPQNWEEKLLRETKGKGEAQISSYMFTKGDPDWRNCGSSYLSAALRTPSFWEHRFTSIGRQIKESNPISYESIARNKPVPNRFTEYHDPDFEDISDLEG